MRHSALFFLLLQSQFFSAQTNLFFLGQKNYTQELSDVWGYAANGKEYALVGVQSGVSIVDVTVPSNPTELFFVTTAASYWHDIATWNGYAYITNETGGGLTIIDLNFLPDSIRIFATDGGIGLTKAHTVFTDENGIAYVAGGNSAAGRGVLMFDVNADAVNPPLIGRYDVHYVHDVYVRNDTMWTAEINNGIFSVVDITDKSNPVVITTNSTPGNTTHNLWLSDSGGTLLTTDEVNNAHIASYDVSNLNNITLLDLFQFNPGFNSLPHNVHYLGDFAVASYYKDGVVIIDASDPQNLIAVGNYDTSPLSGGGYEGCWSVYPYLPSGNILASDIAEGLFVLAPVYEKACYLQGIVTDISSGQPVNHVAVMILPANPTDYTNLQGEYKTGIADSGSYSVQFMVSGYKTHVENNVVLEKGVTTTLNVQLFPAISITLTGTVADVANGQAVSNAQLLFKNSINSYSAVTDSNGNFSINDFETGMYDAFAGKWGYLTRQQRLTVFANTTTAFGLQKGYYDDFIFDFGWTQTATAVSGFWERENPVGTLFGGETSNPDADAADDFGSDCFVTGNGGGQAGNDDVDDGIVTLTSPVFDLTAFHDPFIRYERWFFNEGGNGNPDDSLVVKIFNGNAEVALEIVKPAPGSNSWRLREFRVKDFVSLSSAMRLIFETGDNAASGHLVEAGVDVFSIIDSHFILPPVVDFTADKTEGCPGDVFTLTNLTTNQPQTWFWEFPGGTPPSSTDMHPSVVYQNPGDYTITLSATNGAGTASVTRQSLIVIHEPPVIFAAVTDASAALAADGSIAITVSGTAPFAFEWDDGSTEAVLHNLRPGNYSVTVTDASGCKTSDTATVEFSTSIDGADVTVRCYPNPFSGNLLIECSVNLELSIFNLAGVEMVRMKLNAGNKIEWGKKEKAGVYLLSIIAGNTQKVVKLVKIN
ncbi:MAG TPA: choice-of-anchor B family protein [Chitinophagales bacterium]|nr:choice-of-anchor B family protein [Chitinophagales bacterium]